MSTKKTLYTLILILALLSPPSQATTTTKNPVKGVIEEIKTPLITTKDTKTTLYIKIRNLSTERVVFDVEINPPPNLTKNHQKKKSIALEPGAGGTVRYTLHIPQTTTTTRHDIETKLYHLGALIDKSYATIFITTRPNNSYQKESRIVKITIPPEMTPNKTENISMLVENRDDVSREYTLTIFPPPGFRTHQSQKKVRIPANDWRSVNFKVTPTITAKPGKNIFFFKSGSQDTAPDVKMFTTILKPLGGPRITYAHLPPQVAHGSHFTITAQVYNPSKHRTTTLLKIVTPPGFKTHINQKKLWLAPEQTLTTSFNVSVASYANPGKHDFTLKLSRDSQTIDSYVVSTYLQPKHVRTTYRTITTTKKILGEITGIETPGRIREDCETWVTISVRNNHGYGAEYLVKISSEKLALDPETLKDYIPPGTEKKFVFQGIPTGLGTDQLVVTVYRGANLVDTKKFKIHIEPTPKKEVKKLEANITPKKLVRSKVEQHTPLSVDITIENTGNTKAKPVSITFTPTTQVVVVTGTTTWQGALEPGQKASIGFTIRPDKPGYYSPGKLVVVYSYTDETGVTHTKVEQEQLPSIEVTKKTVSTLGKARLRVERLLNTWEKWPNSLRALLLLTILVIIMLPFLLKTSKPKEKDTIVKIEEEIEEQKRKIEELSKILVEKQETRKENNE